MKFSLQLSLALFLAFVGTAAAAQTTPTRIRSVTTLPATCQAGDGVKPADMVALVASGVNAPYICGITNTWFTPLQFSGIGTIPYFPANGITAKGDPNFTTDGSGNLQAVTASFVGSGPAGLAGFGQGTVPTLTNTHTSYLYGASSIATSFGTALPSAPGTLGQSLVISSVPDATHVVTQWVTNNSFCNANSQGGSDLGARINACDAFLGAGTGEIYAQGGGALTTQVIISTGHTLRMGPGTYTNAHTEYVPAILLADNSALECDNWATIIQNSSNVADAENVIVAGLSATEGNWRGNPDGRLADVSQLVVTGLRVSGCHFADSGVSDDTSLTGQVALTNCHDCQVKNNWFDQIRSTHITLVGSYDIAGLQCTHIFGGPNQPAANCQNNYGYNDEISGNISTGNSDTAISVINNADVNIHDNIFKQHGIGASDYIDVEPNGTLDYAQNINISNNVFDCIQPAASPSFCAGVSVQVASINAHHFKIHDNLVLGPTTAVSGFSVGGIAVGDYNVNGDTDVEIYNNKMSYLYSENGISLAGTTRGWIHDNSILCSNSDPIKLAPDAQFTLVERNRLSSPQGACNGSNSIGNEQNLTSITETDATDDYNIFRDNEGAGQTITYGPHSVIVNTDAANAGTNATSHTFGVPSGFASTIPGGISTTQLSAPVLNSNGPASVNANPTCVISSGGYFYEVTAVSISGGESASSNEVNVNAGGAFGCRTMGWTYIAGAASYNLYRSTSSGTEQLVISVPQGTLGIYDPGGQTPGANVPTANTTNFVRIYDQTPISVTNTALASGVATFTVANTFVTGEKVAVAGAANGTTATITNTALTSNVATYTAANTFVKGQTVTVTGSTNGKVATISNVSLTNNVVTITANNAFLAPNNGLYPDKVTVAAVTNTAVNGTFPLQTATSTTFTYVLTHADIASSADTGTATSTGPFNVTNVPVVSANSTSFTVAIPYRANISSASDTGTATDTANGVFNGIFTVLASGLTGSVFKANIAHGDIGSASESAAKVNGSFPLSVAGNVLNLGPAATVSQAGVINASGFSSSGPDPLIDVTAKAYGADPTGTNDSLAAVKAAMTAACAVSPAGAVVWFPPGTYTFSAQIPNTGSLWCNGLTLMGAGVRTTQLNFSSGSGAAINIAASVRNLTIQGFLLNITTTTTLGGIAYGTGLFDFRLRDIYILAPNTSTALGISGCSSAGTGCPANETFFNFDNVRIDGFGGTGGYGFEMQLSSSGDHFYCHFCYSDNAYVGFHTIGWFQSNIDSSAVDNSTHEAFWFAPGSGNSVDARALSIESNTGNGYFFNGTGKVTCSHCSVQSHNGASGSVYPFESSSFTGDIVLDSPITVATGGSSTASLDVTGSDPHSLTILGGTNGLDAGLSSGALTYINAHSANYVSSSLSVNDPGGTTGASFGSNIIEGSAACETSYGITTLATGASTTDTGLNCLPANAVIDAVVYRITTTITTAVSFTIGDASTAARFCSTQSTLTAGTTATCIVPWTSATAGTAGQASAAKVRVTLNANPGAGAIRLIVYYHTFTPPTS